MSCTGGNGSIGLFIQSFYLTVMPLILFFESFTDHLVHSGDILQVSIDEVRKQSRKVVRERDFFIPIGIHSSHNRIYIVITNKASFCGGTRLSPTMCRHNAFKLFSSELASATHIKGLKELGNLKVKSFLALFLVELCYLSLDFLHHSDFAFK